MDEAFARALRVIGSKNKLAKHLGVTRQAVSRWDSAPVKYIKRISELTNGKVSTDALMRETVESKAAA